MRQQRSGKRATTSKAALFSVAAVSAVAAAQALAVDPNFKVSIGVRESQTASPIGGNGGTAGAIEFVNLDGLNLVANGTWQTFTFNFGTDPVNYFAGTTTGGTNGVLDGVMGALEMLRIRNIDGTTSPIALFVDDLYSTPAGGSPTLVEDFESYAAVTTPTAGAPEVVFRDPNFSGSTSNFLAPTGITGNVTAESAAAGNNSYRLGFSFVNSATSNWVRLTTSGTANRPNPAIAIGAGSTFSIKLRAVVTPILQGWNVDADGSWNDNANWTGPSTTSNVPNSQTAVARFGGALAITAPRTVTVDSVVTANQLVFTSPISYTIAAVPGQGIILGAPAGFDMSLTVEAGSHTITSPLALTNSRRLALSVSNAASTLSVTSPIISAVTDPEVAVTNDLVKSGAGTAEIQRLRVGANAFNAVALNGGTLRIAPNGTDAGTSVVNSLTISGTAAAPTAKLDLTNNYLIVDWDDEATTPRPDALTFVRNRIVAGYATGDWSGNGITSSTAAANPNYALGYGDATGLGLTTFGGVTLDDDATLVRYTLKGDSDLNGTVNFDDLLALAKNYNPSYDPVADGPKLWKDNDTDYNGIVDFNDLLALAKNYNGSVVLAEALAASTGGAFEADFALAQALVPEPTTLGLLGGAITLLGRRRRA